MKNAATEISKELTERKTMRTAQEISDVDGKTLVDWCAAANVEATLVNILTLAYFCDRHANGLITTENLNAAASSSELSHLVWVHLPTPANYKEVAQAWLNLLPAGLRHGLGADLSTRVAGIIKAQHGNHYSVENLDAALETAKVEMFGTPPPAPEKPKPYTGIKRDETRVNHAHDNDAPAPLGDTEIQQVLMSTLTALAKGGHKQFVNEENHRLKEELRDGKGWAELQKLSHARTSDYLAGLAIARIMETVPGATDGARIANRAHLQKIVRAGQHHGMSKPDIAKMVKLEYEGMDNRSLR